VVADKPTLFHGSYKSLGPELGLNDTVCHSNKRKYVFFVIFLFFPVINLVRALHSASDNILTSQITADDKKKDKILTQRLDVLTYNS
jgi:hypothetical protein